ncbi:hypothetical protein, partial [Salmonella sp. SAL04281]|uniref:hypothetical protein n=1 Tax=Salmonella sp. SAL04281 TaxID=3159859 RepID=UPI0039795035
GRNCQRRHEQRQRRAKHGHLPLPPIMKARTVAGRGELPHKGASVAQRHGDAGNSLPSLRQLR